jgi:nicotinamidase-related amidase
MPSFTLVEPWGLPSHHNYFDAARTGLIVVDMQYGCVHPDYGLSRIMEPDAKQYFFDRLDALVVPNIQRLLEVFREQSRPVIYLTISSEREDGGDLGLRLQRRLRQMLAETGLRTVALRGSIEQQVIAAIAPRPGELIINKTSYGAFNSTSIDQTLHNLGITGLVFVGAATNACVETTARDAADRGYDCILVDDGCAALDQTSHDATMRIFAQAFGEVSTTDAVIERFKHDTRTTAVGVGPGRSQRT